MTDESYKVVSTADEAEHDIYAHEVRTNTNFTIYRRNKGFSSTDTIDYKAHKIWWEDGKADDRCKIDTNGCPYIILGYDVRECQHGPDRNIKKKIQYKAEKEEKSKTDPSYVMKGRTLIQNTKKMICPARITQRRIIKFPGYRLENSSSKWRRKQTAKTLRKALDESSVDVVKEEEIHMYYPTADDHKNHTIGEVAGLCQPVGPEVKAKIRQLVGDGVTKVSEMKRHLKVFVKKELEIEDQTIPSRRFYPTDKDIRNHMDTTKNKFRFSKDDQTNLEHLVQGWTKTFPDDNFFLRTCLHGPEDRTSDEKFVFVHQSRWQKRLLNLYGKEICFLDATYNRSKYDLPLFFICVNTNVGYINVATFITADELAESIKEALQKIMQWNEDWNPPYFMTDNDSCEISAIEESLPVYANELTGVEIDEIQVLERVKGIWDQEEETGYIVAKVFNINITDGDIRSLRDKHWLTDQVMDAYLGCLANWENDQHRKVFRIPTAAMTKILSGECSINTTLQNVHLMDYDILLGAYYQDGAHWDLMIIEPMTGSLYFYNPLGESAGQKNNILLNWRMFIERRIMIGLEIDKNMAWNTIPKQHSKQHDGSSCGVYVLTFAERHLRNEQLTDIGQYEIKLGRKRIANKLLWFEVYLCDCCPVCGFMIQDDQEMEKCRLCKRSFHKTPFCMGDQHHLQADRFECRQCLVNTWTKENSCQNALKSGKRKSEQNLTAEVTMDKISKQDQKSPIEVCLDILQSNGFHEDACTTFIHNLSCIDWHISWESIVEIFAKVRTCVPDVADNIITCSKSRSLGHFGDGYIDYIPLKFKRDHIFPADMEGSGTWTLFRSVSILFYGDESHMQFARLLTICNEIIEIGKGCDSDDHQKDLILEEMKKEFDSPCCDMEDELALYHLMRIPNALNLNIQILKEGASVYYEGQNGKRSISILALQKVGDLCLSFLPFMEGIFLNDRKISDHKDKCGAGVFCQGNSLYKKCLKCFQTYHSSCIISHEEAFVCGCHIRRPYHPKDLNIYKDEVRFIETLDMVDIKYIELRNKISSKGAVKENDEKLLDVFLPEVMVSFVMMVEGLNRFQSELFLRTDIHKLIQPSSE
ncbi:uncharacterized protein LOC134721481 isoform X2 [Mytilus trossulus]|uniref:uncharacterized protein LOC134721481 isoform X2 n=4 Tax=Mytilus trossulus TaxID=6551 RepID=UPI0030048B10